LFTGGNGKFDWLFPPVSGSIRVTSGLLPGMSLSAMTTPRMSFIEFIVIASDLTQPEMIGSLPV
jgi:hypothetical protein